MGKTMTGLSTIEESVNYSYSGSAGFEPREAYSSGFNEYPVVVLQKTAGEQSIITNHVSFKC